MIKNWMIMPSRWRLFFASLYIFMALIVLLFLVMAILYDPPQQAEAINICLTFNVGGNP